MLVNTYLANKRKFQIHIERFDSIVMVKNNLHYVLEKEKLFQFFLIGLLTNLFLLGLIMNEKSASSVD